MTRTLPGAWLVGMTLACAFLLGCAAPPPAEAGAAVRDERVALCLSAGADHAWTYYPLLDAYTCAAHGQFWIHEDAQWALREPPPTLGEGVALEPAGPYPYLHGHAWVYFPRHGVYYCRLHDRFWVREGAAWAYRRDLGATLVGGVSLPTTVARPFLNNVRHQREYGVPDRPLPPPRARPSRPAGAAPPA